MELPPSPKYHIWEFAPVLALLKLTWSWLAVLVKAATGAGQVIVTGWHTESLPQGLMETRHTL